MEEIRSGFNCPVYGVPFDEYIITHDIDGYYDAQGNWIDLKGDNNDAD